MDKKKTAVLHLFKDTTDEKIISVLQKEPLSFEDPYFKEKTIEALKQKLTPVSLDIKKVPILDADGKWIYAGTAFYEDESVYTTFELVSMNHQMYVNIVDSYSEIYDSIAMPHLWDFLENTLKESLREPMEERLKQVKRLDEQIPPPVFEIQYASHTTRRDNIFFRFEGEDINRFGRVFYEDGKLKHRFRSEYYNTRHEKNSILKRSDWEKYLRTERECSVF